MNLTDVLIRTLFAVVVGTVIGGERARHGRAAGIRTHILVCLGAALTSMSSLYVASVLNYDGDVFRISAQVISGVGFLGAGMIILKNNNMITGLTTAAGVWATGAIGVAIGYGFFSGAAVSTVIFLVVIIFFAKFEKKKSTEVLYAEIDDMYRTNEIIRELKTLIKDHTTIQTVAPKSGEKNHLGLVIVAEKRITQDPEELCQIAHVVFAVEEVS